MKKLKISDERVKVTATFYEEGSVLRGDKHGEVDGFELAVSLDSEEPEAVIADMLALAHKMCFTEAVLRQSVPLSVTHQLNGLPLVSN